MPVRWSQTPRVGRHFAVAREGSLLVAVFQRRMDDEAAETLLEAARRGGYPRAYLHFVSTPDADAVRPEGGTATLKLRLLRVLREVRDYDGKMAIVIDVEGFVGAAYYAFSSALLSATRTPGERRLFREVDDAARWLAPFSNESESALLERVEDLRKRVRKL